jgi:hypothetical protein
MDVNADRIFAGKSMSSWMAAFARREVVDELRRQVADIKTHPFDVELMKHRIEKRISEIESEGA